MEGCWQQVGAVPIPRDPTEVCKYLREGVQRTQPVSLQLCWDRTRGTGHKLKHGGGSNST